MTNPITHYSLGHSDTATTMNSYVHAMPQPHMQQQENH